MTEDKSSDISRALPFYLFTAGVFLILVCKDIFSNGMFLDGVVYSTVSKNLAIGTGTFWNPSFTSTCMPEFHQHPPLAFGIQSIFYRLLGQGRITDKIYSLLTVLLTAYIILRIWKISGYKHGWIPLFFWIITPTVFWASYNNLLENTLTIFTSLSVLFFLIYRGNSNYFYLFLSGFILAPGFLTKGFVAFFPWTFPFFLWLFLKEKPFRRIFIDCVVIVLSSLVPLLLLILFSPAAKVSLHNYLDDQVISSLSGAVTVDSRFDIVIRLFSELAPAAVLCIIILVWYRLKNASGFMPERRVKKALVYIFLGLSGVLPIMISMKQSGFYIIPAYPFFAVAAGILVYSSIDSLVLRINSKSKGFVLFRLIGYCMFITGIVLSVYFSNQYSRDKNLIKDTYVILPEIPNGSIINISPDMNEDFSLHAYFNRFKNISLDPELTNKREFLLIKNENFSDTLKSDYNLIKLNTTEYQLFKKK
jgi:4-amino-4-deoxy-L-arabinose transferase-like glycosyltransferase